MKKLYSKSIYFQNFLRTAIILLVCFIVFGVTFSSITYQYLASEKRASMEHTGEEVAKIVSAYSYEWELQSFETRMVLTEAANISGYSILVLDNSGTVTAASAKTIHSEYIGKQVPSEVVETLNASGSYVAVTELGGLYGEKSPVVGRVISSPETGRAIGYVLISDTNGLVPAMWKDFSLTFLVISVIVLITALIVTYYQTKQLAQPLNEMAAAATRFAHGDYGVRVMSSGRRDEIGELTDAFNLMANSIERSEGLRREFISNVSHELKTPMTTITGFAEGILDGTIPPQKQEKYLKIIASETKRLSRLVKSMLEMSQLRAVDPAEILKKRFDLAETARLTVLSLEKKILDRGLNVETQIPDDAMTVKGDEDSITQVIYNLVDNAIKFSFPDSTVKIEVWKQNKKAYVSVENNGETIKPDELELIFDRFHKSDASRSLDKDGVGLGLYIVKTILDNHNESIFVTSRGGVTRFVFTLALGE